MSRLIKIINNYLCIVKKGFLLSDKIKLFFLLPINFISRQISSNKIKYDLTKVPCKVFIKDIYERKKRVYFYFDLFMLSGTAFSKEFIKILENKKYKNIIDIGASVGAVGLYFLLQDKNRKCVFVEPQLKVTKITKEFLKDNSDIFKNKNYHLYAYALGSKKEIRNLKYTEKNDQAATLDVKNKFFNHKKKMKIHVNTLDNMLQELKIKYIYIDLIKIDVEGFETEVIRGAKKFFKQIKNIDIIVEIFNNEKFKKFTNILDSYGLDYDYKIIDINNENKIKDYFFKIRQKKLKKKQNTREKRHKNGHYK